MILLESLKPRDVRKDITLGGKEEIVDFVRDLVDSLDIRAERTRKDDC